MYFCLTILFFINAYTNHISGQDFTQAYLNNILDVNVNSTKPTWILYNIPVCKEKKFLRIKFESILKTNEIVTVKSQSDKSVFKLENKYNQSTIVARRIICSKSQMNQCGNTENSTIKLSTNSTANISIRINAEMIKDFTLKVGENRNKIEIDEYSPVYWLLQFNDTNEDMEVKIVSDDDQCMFTFIEEAECSLNILNPHVESLRKKTITKNGSIQIKNNGHYINNSLFIVFILADDKFCKTNLNNQKLSEIFRRKNINITFVNIDTNYLRQAIGLFVIFCVIGILYVVTYYFVFLSDKCNQIVKEDSIPLMEENTNKDETNRLGSNIAKSNKHCLNKKIWYFMCWRFKYFLTSKYIVILSIFYTLPVIQLILYYVNVMNVHGNFDLCFYNDGCSKPYKKLLAFNNVISNIGYMILGLVFIIIVFIRHYYKNRQKLSISINYGVFYALGLSLIMEGVMSLIYHICPRSDTIQFDATFMYIIGCLLIYYYAIQLTKIFDILTIVNKDYIITINKEHDIIKIKSKNYLEPNYSKTFKLTIKAKESSTIINSNCFTTMINSKENNVTFNWKDISETNISKDNNIKINSTDYTISIDSDYKTNSSISKDYGSCSDSEGATSTDYKDNISTTNLIVTSNINDNHITVNSENYIIKLNFKGGSKIKNEEDKIITINSKYDPRTNDPKLYITTITTVKEYLKRNSKFNDMKINSADNTITINFDDNNEMNSSMDNTIKINLVNYKITFYPDNAIYYEKNNNKLNSLDLKIIIDSDERINTNNSNDNITICSERGIIKSNSVDKIIETENKKRTINSNESEFRVKEFFFLMSILILFIILILICEGIYSEIVKWIFIGIVQALFVLFYCWRIFKCGKFDICKKICISIIVGLNLLIFGGSCSRLSFYFYFLLAILGNVGILKVQFCVKIFKVKQILKSNCRFITFLLVNIVFMLILWGLAVYAFVKAPTDWHKSPSESREHNQDCIILDFYDIHDLWHILSSLAIFLTFMIIFLLDCWIYEEENVKGQLKREKF